MVGYQNWRTDLITVEEIERLRRLTWAALSREALEAGVTIGAIRRAKTRDELRLAILKAREVRPQLS